MKRQENDRQTWLDLKEKEQIAKISKKRSRLDSSRGEHVMLRVNVQTLLVEMTTKKDILKLS